LVIAAHPDDEVLGAGATIARAVKEGHSVHVAILGEGVTSRFERREQADARELDALQAKARAAAETMGAASVSLHGMPDNRFDTVALLDVIKVVEQLVKTHQPQTIYTHHLSDLNIDHHVTSRAVLTATRPTEGYPVRELFMFEVPSSTEWGFQRFSPPFTPSVFVDVTETLDTKIRALAHYESEVRAFPHPRSPEALRSIAQRWGSVVGLRAAEAFELVRAVR
jgi:LmbE family N-acetylglucosaminyl deacetylase